MVTSLKVSASGADAVVVNMVDRQEGLIRWDNKVLFSIPGSQVKPELCSTLFSGDTFVSDSVGEMHTSIDCSKLC